MLGPEMEQLKGGQQYQIVLLSLHNNWLKVKTFICIPLETKFVCHPIGFLVQNRNYRQDVTSLTTYCPS